MSSKEKKAIQKALDKLRSRVARQYRDDELWAAIEEIQAQIGVKIETEVERVIKFQKARKKK